jgi:DedD protein
VNRRYDSDIDLEDRHSNSEGDHEISLGTSTILGIFFTLALICAVFFGFGYSMGKRSAQPLAATQSDTEQPATQSALNKPAPGSFAPAPDKQSVTDESTASAPDSQPDATTGPAAQPAIQPVSFARTSAPSTGASTSVVQVAAVSHKEDATILLSALKKRGYTASVRQEPQDKLLHVQLGPFPNKKDADAMRDHLISDGYNAIVK